MAPQPGIRGRPAIGCCSTRRFGAAPSPPIYDSFAVDDKALERGLAEGSLAVDTRLRDALRDLRADDGTFVLPGEERRLAFPRPTAPEDAAYAAEASVLVEIDGIVRAEHRVRALERRLDALEEGPRRVARRLARR